MPPCILPGTGWRVAESTVSADLRRLLDGARGLAEDAGDRILDIYRKGFTVAHKADATPVTDADMAAHDLIAAGLHRLDPDIPVLSEESDPIPFATRRRWRRHWLVDPLDGTRQFVRHNDDFAVNIALVEGHIPVLGVIHAPVAGTTFWATKGGGAYRGVARTRSAQRLRVRVYRGGPVRVLVSRAPPGKRLQRFLDRLGEFELRRVGSSLKSCLIAEGSADLYPRFGPTGEWDTAAAQILLEEAGGHLTDTRLSPLRYNTRDSLINPHFFAYCDADADWSRFLD